MTEMTQITIDAKVNCSDGPCGSVIRVVVDPATRSVTHIVVEPKHRTGLGRLVPLDLVEVTPDETRLDCTLMEFEQLPNAEEMQLLPLNNDFEQFSMGQVLYRPLYVQGINAEELGLEDSTVPIVYDVLPEGELAVRRGDLVHATDGNIGKVQGLVVDPNDGHVTHVLLQEGHLWGKREVAIPISNVISINEGIFLDISKSEVESLPNADNDHTDNSD